MDTGIGEDCSPKSQDLEGWRKAIESGRLASFKLEEIAAAFQVLGGRDKQVQNALADYLSVSILRILRRRVGANHPNGGEDIILRTHHQIIVALLRPTTADGKGLREAFVARVEYRLKDAIATENRQRRVPNDGTHAKSPDDEDEQQELIVEAPSTIGNREIEPEEQENIALKQAPRPLERHGTQDLDEKLDVTRVLERIADPRKRLAFYLYMNDIPYYSKKKEVHSIARALNISDKTARNWVEEVRLELKTDAKVQYLKNGE